MILKCFFLRGRQSLIYLIVRHRNDVIIMCKIFSVFLGQKCWPRNLFYVNYQFYCLEFFNLGEGGRVSVRKVFDRIFWNFDIIFIMIKYKSSAKKVCLHDFIFFARALAISNSFDSCCFPPIWLRNVYGMK